MTDLTSFTCTCGPGATGDRCESSATVTGLADTCAFHFGFYNGPRYNKFANPLACYVPMLSAPDYDTAVAK